MGEKGLIVVLIVGLLTVVLVLTLIACHKNKPDYKNLPGNGKEYSPENAERNPDPVLANKNILFLGSSVTFGAASLGTSFVEVLAKRNGFTYVKEAVGGTTLVTEDDNSYLPRLKAIDSSTRFDLFVCQLSTNDASKDKPLGSVTDTEATTICGAVNTIIDYARKTWGCPIVFYTNAHYENEKYESMVVALKDVAQRKNVGVIDLYSDAGFNGITAEERSLYMADDVHPTKAGYLLWWSPKMEGYLTEFLSRERSDL